MSTLTQKTCRPLAKGSSPLARERVDQYLGEIQQWELDAEARTITRSFSFKNYYQTIGFVNALAWIAHREDHHPDLEVSYNRCVVHFSTHSVGGLSENDFICAAKVDQLVPG